ncbi:Putative stomatin/prohibitin-family membrane protease subunit PA4582 [hydrothermal vent metagenome]|uniref:Stomatin/prohibitin-family membrane protease subunit PA4582 n=1 Tax=hydrothermal vent metagenome TaxID=652676 RepID=A0A3B0ZXT2_9ZZZZ
MMFGIKRIVIAQHERGVYLKDRSIVKILEPGIYRIFDLLGRVAVEVHNLTVSEFDHPYVDVLVKENRDLVDKYFQFIELGEYEVGLVYKNGKLSGVLKPGTRQLYWKGLVDVNVEVLNIEQDFSVPKAKVGLIANARMDSIPGEVVNYVYIAEVSDNHIGLLVVDGEMVKSLKPGLYAYWKFNRNVKVEQVELRMQVMEVQGQEILTKDKVSLRVNLSAQYQITDPVAARSKLVNVADYVYREMQFALRQVVGTRTLDALLGNKDELDKVIFLVVKEKIADFGIEVRSVGVKDVILPGDMKDILNKVVEAEKVAQANVIKRREETAATRSLLNTARLMEDNPTLMRLKELEVLEKVTEKVDKLTVFGGLEGVLKDTIKIKVNAD